MRPLHFINVPWGNFNAYILGCLGHKSSRTGTSYHRHTCNTGKIYGSNSIRPFLFKLITMIKFNLLSFLWVVGAFILKSGKLKVSVQEDPQTR